MVESWLTVWSHRLRLLRSMTKADRNVARIDDDVDSDVYPHIDIHVADHLFRMKRPDASRPVVRSAQTATGKAVAVLGFEHVVMAPVVTTIRLAWLMKGVDIAAPVFAIVSTGVLRVTALAVAWHSLAIVAPNPVRPDGRECEGRRQGQVK